MISGRRRSVIFFTVLGICLIAVAVTLNISWIAAVPDARRLAQQLVGRAADVRRGLAQQSPRASRLGPPRPRLVRVRHLLDHAAGAQRVRHRQRPEGREDPPHAPGPRSGVTRAARLPARGAGHRRRAAGEVLGIGRRIFLSFDSSASLHAASKGGGHSRHRQRDCRTGFRSAIVELSRTTGGNPSPHRAQR